VIHRNREEFIKTLERTSAQKGFLLSLVEKDYYLTLILSKVHELSENLVFKGGTCLSKVYYDYYRLSEDLDFSMILPSNDSTRGQRRKSMQPVKEKIEKFADHLDMKIEGTINPGRNESRQCIYYFVYKSVIRPVESKIKFEIGLRSNPLDPVIKRRIKHFFLHPFTGDPIFDGGMVGCLSLDELISEKLRAAATRKTIAPRDFYDLDFILRQNFTLSKKEVLRLFVNKLKEDEKDPDLKKYRINLGRSDEEIENMSKRINTELIDVLAITERKKFDLGSALARINKAMENAAG